MVSAKERQLVSKRNELKQVQSLYINESTIDIRRLATGKVLCSHSAIYGILRDKVWLVKALICVGVASYGALQTLTLDSVVAYSTQIEDTGTGP